MKKLILLAGCAALAACSQEEVAPVENVDTNVAAADTTAPVPAAFQLNETSWTFTRNGEAQQESIDASGNYIVNAGDKHVDHGTAVIKDGKACFTSAMTEEGEVCWSSTQMEAGEAVEVGQSMEATSDKGEKLTVTRVAYAPLSMP